ncbi:MAG: N-acetyltransferase [Candidatus Roizmanbacteria bacterium]|nr:MAG: N-acetyltransferase [Candidatus Roizmanbacteria bacterium]
MRQGRIVYQGNTKKGNEIVIRYPIPEDLKAMTDYMNALSLEQTFITFQGEQLTLKEEKKYLQGILKKIQKREAVKLFVFHKNQLIGISDIVMQERTSAHVGIFGLTITKDHRGEGIGKLLMELVINEGITHIPQLRIITLGVFANNPIAYGLYKKFGFIKLGKIPGGIKHKNKYIDYISMYKIIK